ncbi:MAG: hypothetical protein OXC83_10765 [Chloroflexi bacterium]|nr:hypothetical protein [Chloroflexota bacterium]
MMRTKEELDAIADRAKAYYHGGIKDQLSDSDKGRFVTIDANSGEWELHDDMLEGILRLRDRVSDPEPFTLRHITITTTRFGSAPFRPRR